LKSFYNYSNYIFDFDNTLFHEIDYLKIGYLKISKFLESNSDLKSNQIYDFLYLTFLNEGRKNLFNKLFTKFNINPNKLNSILEILRSFESERKFNLYPKSYKILKKLIELNKLIFIITNGNQVQQNNKIKMTNWMYIKHNLKFILANDFEKKPSNLSFKYIEEKFSLKLNKTIMIGDSSIDEEFALNCGIDFINIKNLRL
tara:strand:- start:3381 stop:3983 length:603 start_codon:yes stop_codon:yes gene_type:complete